MLQGVSVPSGIGRVFDYGQTGGVYRMLLVMLLKNKHNFRVSLRLDRVGMLRVSRSIAWSKLYDL